ncbi:DUF6545 domain-containing protein [Gordonia aquimaris]|uniref:DUF6545 domain-containing protein n=1 Tax=Gordonia aquimaris TaxID=2984863 RepID=A0A9X3I5X7_9ACTN|nr:DUF6545 domain-containing protein [Gordonia aquimaris]MCX2966268.1 hypothetical protein [Gordonia aquimaris]
MALRNATVQGVLADLGVTLTDVRSLTHLFVLLSAAALAVVGFLWERGRLPSRRLPYWLVAAAFVIAAALWLLASPARSQGIAVEELEGWRTAAYMTLYSLPTPIAELPALFTAVVMLRERSTRPRLLFGAVVLVAIASSWLDHLYRLVTGWFLAFGADNDFTDARSGSNDALFLPILAVLVIIGIPNIVSSFQVRFGRDPDSLSVRLLAPLWRSLTSALPEYRLVETHTFVHPAEMAYRMRIEIDECVVELAGWLPDGATWPEDATGRAALLEEALERFRAGRTRSHASAPAWLKSDTQIDDVARAWRGVQPTHLGRPSTRTSTTTSTHL